MTEHPITKQAIRNSMVPFISIITPIYNRKKFLLGLYESLDSQTCKDFEWIVVDDGSMDEPEAFFRETCIKSFPARYIKKENGGKHTAVNLGVKEANGELVLILDSDDTLPKDSIEKIQHYYSLCKERKDCGGVCGLMAHHDGSLIGKGFAQEHLYENSLDLRYRLHVTGDLLEVFKTTVLRECPFPEIASEKFCPEALVWNRIATKYKLYCFNEVVYHRDYLDGGLTDKIVKIRMNSPIATMMTYQELTVCDIPLLPKMKAAINYWRFRWCCQQKDKSGITIPTINWYWNIFMPIGWMMHLKDVKSN
ncbi:MAG: glycosyltransferase family A protein [Prevotella sp.]|nr:glycosyltransferase family 2 protein [Prevotella sp.]MDY6131324.1 glycosyltransferase family A protein [Prevotella sp.]